MNRAAERLIEQLEAGSRELNSLNRESEDIDVELSVLYDRAALALLDAPNSTEIEVRVRANVSWRSSEEYSKLRDRQFVVHRRIDELRTELEKVRWKLLDQITGQVASVVPIDKFGNSLVRTGGH